jgi:hypothetical protein
MTRDLEIEQAILGMDQESYARMAAAVLERDGYPTFSVNTVSGKVRSRKGVPDALCEHSDGTYSFLQCTVQVDRLPKKLHDDLEDCFAKKPRRIARTTIREVILACSERILPELRATLKADAKAMRTKVVLYDLDRIKRVILEKGDDIAEDHLGIKLIAQVLSREAFVKRAARTGPVNTDYSTTFRFREEELDRARVALKAQPIVLIAGNAGVGKTRLGLEVMDRMKAMDPDLHLLYVRNQGVPFADELAKRCSAPGRYLVLLDDAHRMGDLPRVLDLLGHERNDREIHVLCTVRRIALAHVREILGIITDEAQLILDPWTDDELRTFLDKQYNIQRNLYVDRILDMARGNPRTAAMVASIINQVGDYNGFTHVAQAFRLYYKEHLDRISAFANVDSLRVLFSFAFFHHIEGTAYEMPILPRLLPLLGMEQETFWSHARDLDQMELINLLGDEGPGLIADETFGTFLVHHVLFETRRMDLRKLLITFFDGYREKIVTAINAVLNIFQAEVEAAVLKKAVLGAFRHFEEEENDGVLLELHEVFHDVDPTRTLEYVDQLIRVLPAEAQGTPYLFADERNDHSLDAPLRILRCYGTGDPKDVRSTAVDLMLAFLERQPTKGAQVVKALVGAFDLHELAEATGYQDQRDVAEQLIGLSQAGNAAATGLFYGLSHNYLAAQSWRVVPTRKRNQISSRIHVPYLNEPMKALRRIVWDHLFELYKRPEQRERVIKAMKDHLAAFDVRGNKKLVAFDAELIEGFFMGALDPQNNAHCILVRDLLQHWQRQGVKVGPALSRYFTNPTFKLMQVLRYEPSLADEDDDTVEPYEVWKQRLQNLGEGTSPVECQRTMLRAKRIIQVDPMALDPLGPSRAITWIMIGAFSNEPEVLVQEIERLAAQGDPLQLDPFELIPVLLKAIGAEALERLIAAGGLRQRWSWWHSFYAEVAKHTDRLHHPEDFEERCLNALAKGQFMYFSLALHFKEQCPGLLVKLVRVAVDRAEEHGRSNHLFDQLFDGKRTELDSIIGLFAAEQELLQRAFFWAVVEHGLHRKAADIFLELVELDPSFVARWVQWRYAKSYSAPQPEDFRLPAIWKREDVADLMDAAFAIASTKPKVFVGCDDYLSFFFNPTVDGAISDAVIGSQNAWLHRRIAVGYSDESSCQVLLGIVHTLPEERRLELIMHFIDQHPDQKAFRRTALDARLSRVVVRVNGAPQSRLPFLQKLLERCTGRTRLPYRVAVEEAIQLAQRELKAAQHEAIIEGRA